MGSPVLPVWEEPGEKNSGKNTDSLLLFGEALGIIVLASRWRTIHVVGVVQLAEHQIVVLGVVGSSPIIHPIFLWDCLQEDAVSRVWRNWQTH